MTDALKELIENAPIKRQGTFLHFLAVSNGEYNGFWGNNGFDSILLFGFDAEDGKYYKITDYADSVGFFGLTKGCFSMDIPSEYGVPRIWFHTPIEIDNELDLSTISGMPVEPKKKNKGE